MKRTQYSSLPAAVVAVLTFVVYLPALRNDFVNWDDGLYIVNNQHIRALDLPFFRWAFTDTTVDYWQPLSWISHAVDYALWGLDPFGHHLTSILLHTVNTFLVVSLAARLLSVDSFLKKLELSRPAVLTEQGILIAAAVTGLLFGLHPVHVESVAWVTERKDVLYALFYLLSIMVYTSYALEQQALTGRIGKGAFRSGSYLLALAFFVLALASKPMAVTLPVVLLILDWYPLRRASSWRETVTVLVEKIPFFLCSLLASVLTMRQQQEHVFMSSLQEVSLSSRLTTAAAVPLEYLRMMVAPLHLRALYPPPQNAAFWSPDGFLPFLLMLGITAGCIVALRKGRPVLLAVLGFYLITLLPVLGIIRVGVGTVADRFTYLASLGPFLLVGLAVSWIWTWTGGQSQWRRVLRYITTGAGMCLVIVMVQLTLGYISVWKDGITLWTNVIEQDALGSPLAYGNRGMLYGQAGDRDRALKDLTSAIALSPDYAEAYMNRGVVLGQTGQFDQAIEDLNEAIRLNPAYVQAYLNRAEARLGAGQTGRAIEDYTRALALNPEFATAYLDRGGVYLEQGRRELALVDFQAACDRGSDEGCQELRRLTQW